jgi:hypothetical protein
MIAYMKAANSYYKRNNLNPLTMSYPDEKFVAEYKLKSKMQFPSEKNKLSTDIDYNSEVKKKRYNIRYEFEDVKRNEDMQTFNKSSFGIKRPYRYKPEYDIITLDDRNEQNLFNKNWDNIIKTSTGDKLITSKIYKDYYDTSDAYDQHNQFISERKSNRH